MLLVQKTKLGCLDCHVCQTDSGLAYDFVSCLILGDQQTRTEFTWSLQSKGENYRVSFLSHKTHACTHTHACKTCTHACMRSHTHSDMHAHMCMHTHTYIHTHTHSSYKCIGKKVLILERRIREENFHCFSEQHGNKAALYHSVSEYVVAGLGTLKYRGRHFN